MIRGKSEARVSVYRHRHRRAGTNPEFRDISKVYHRQTPTVPRPKNHRNCCSCHRDGYGYTWSIPPDVFEVAAREECVICWISDDNLSAPQNVVAALALEQSWRAEQIEDADCLLPARQHFDVYFPDESPERKMRRWATERAQRWGS